MQAYLTYKHYGITTVLLYFEGSFIIKQTMTQKSIWLWYHIICSTGKVFIIFSESMFTHRLKYFIVVTLKIKKPPTEGPHISVKQTWCMKQAKNIEHGFFKHIICMLYTYACGVCMDIHMIYTYAWVPLSLALSLPLFASLSLSHPLPSSLSPPPLSLSFPLVLVWFGMEWYMKVPYWIGSRLVQSFVLVRWTLVHTIRYFEVIYNWKTMLNDYRSILLWLALNFISNQTMRVIEQKDY